EAYMHNVPKFFISAGPAAYYATMASNPGGWPILGLTGVGYGGSLLYEKAYDTNFIGTQTAVDTTGNFFQGAFDTIKDGYDYIDEGIIGDAIRQNAENMNHFFGW